MIKCSTESALKAELSDLYQDLTLLDSISLELQYHGEDLKTYRYWLRHTMANTISLLATLTDIPKPIYHTEYHSTEELKDLTKRTKINFKRTYLAYNKEAGPYKQQLGIILFYISLWK